MKFIRDFLQNKLLSPKTYVLGDRVDIETIVSKEGTYCT